MSDVPAVLHKVPPAYDYVVKGVDAYSGREIRDFANMDLAASVAKAVAGLAPTDHGALVAFADGSDMKIGVMGRVGAHLSYMGVLDHKWVGGWNPEATVIYRF